MRRQRTPTTVSTRSSASSIAPATQRARLAAHELAALPQRRARRRRARRPGAPPRCSRLRPRPRAERSRRSVTARMPRRSTRWGEPAPARRWNPACLPQFVKDVGTALLVLRSVREGDRDEPMALVEATGTRVLLERMKPNRTREIPQRIRQQLGADPACDAIRGEVQMIDPSTPGSVVPSQQTSRPGSHRARSGSPLPNVLERSDERTPVGSGRPAADASPPTALVFRQRKSLSVACYLKRTGLLRGRPDSRPKRGASSRARLSSLCSRSSRAMRRSRSPTEANRP